MTLSRTETSQLLAIDAAYSRRTVGRSDIEAWHHALEDLDYEPARQAVVAFYKRAGANTSAFVKPGDIRAHIETGLARLEVENRKAAQLDARDQREQRQLVHTAARPDPGVIGGLHAEALGAPCRYCRAAVTEPCRNLAAEPGPDGLHPAVRVPHVGRINDRRHAIEQDVAATPPPAKVDPAEWDVEPEENP